MVAEILVAEAITAALTSYASKRFHSAIKAQLELRLQDAQRERDQALERTKRAEHMLDEVRAQIMNVTPPVPIDPEPDIVTLPDEVLNELNLIEDPADRADFAASARAYLAEHPDAEGQAVAELVFG